MRINQQNVLPQMMNRENAAFVGRIGHRPKKSSSTVLVKHSEVFGTVQLPEF